MRSSDGLPSEQSERVQGGVRAEHLTFESGRGYHLYILSTHSLFVDVDLSIPPSLRRELFGLSVRQVFEYFRVGGVLGLRYDAHTAEHHLPIRTPRETLKRGGGHCFELSLLLTQALRSADYPAEYLDMPYFYRGMHASVRCNGVILDPARSIFNPHYRKFSVIRDPQAAYLLASAYLLLDSREKSSLELGCRYVMEARLHGAHIPRFLLGHVREVCGQTRIR